ncbi:hypothetical protein PR048_002749 [Dryococelus australis]|uniref:Uncharacterized protein n=1 Tax=Dryococelus australis TaxID=614101 RepID=A0ABQ9IL19_9NEOP|nr:hypothetical protein PR048_002749 [Dryococelus australis]
MIGTKDTGDADNTGLTSKKIPGNGRVTDAAKRLPHQTHETGENCKCKRLKCFENACSYDEQNVYLAGLITVCEAATRRPRKEEDEADFYSASYKYTIRVKRDGFAVDIPICCKAMLALHGIIAQPQMFPNYTTVGIHEHINSYKGRHSAHYNFNDSKRLYLSETLNIRKIHQLYTEKYTNNKVSYETFRNLYNTKHNISFDFPRRDTCSSSDSYKVNKESLEAQLAKVQVGNEDVLALAPSKAQEITRDLNKMETEHKLH